MNVQFDEGFKRRRTSGDKTTAMGRLFMKLSGGAIKNQQQANAAILVTTIIVFAVTLYIIFT